MRNGKSTVGLYSANAIAKDGTKWIVYFDVETFAQAENIVKLLGLNIDDAGVGLVVEEGPTAHVSTNFLRTLN